MIKSNLKQMILAVVLATGIMACNNEGSTTTDTKDSAATDNMGQTPVQPSTDSTVAAQQSDSVLTQNADAMLAADLVESMYGGIALMKDGQQKAASSAVKQLAKKLEASHTLLTKDLKALASKKGWSTPTGESAADKSTRENMAKESAADYEKDWLAALKNRHETNIGKLENAHPADADLAAMGKKAVPKLKDLLASIDAVQKQVK